MKSKSKPIVWGRNCNLFSWKLADKKTLGLFLLIWKCFIENFQVAIIPFFCYFASKDEIIIRNSKNKCFNFYFVQKNGWTFIYWMRNNSSDIHQLVYSIHSLVFVQLDGDMFHSATQLPSDDISAQLSGPLTIIWLNKLRGVVLLHIALKLAANSSRSEISGMNCNHPSCTNPYEFCDRIHEKWISASSKRRYIVLLQVFLLITYSDCPIWTTIDQ